MRSWSRFLCSTPTGTEFRQHFPAVLQIHVPEGSLCIRRTTGKWCRISISNGSRPWKLTRSTHPRAVQKMWTIRNRYGRTYAKFCIIPSVSISNGRRLTRLHDIQTCGTKSRVLYASPCYMSCKLRWVAQVVRWRNPAMGTRWRCSVLQKKNNMCEIIINDLLLLAISTKNIELVLYASEMFRFIWSWTCSGRNHLNKRGSWYTWNHVTHPAQPSYQHKRGLLWAWMCHMV